MVAAQVGGARTTLLRGSFVLLISGLFAILAIQAVTREQSEWQDVYVRAAATFWAHGDIYRPDSAYA